MNFGNVAVLASVIASLVAVPAASATITGDISAATATITDTKEEATEQMPRKISETLDDESFTKTVETAFGTATFTSQAGEFTSELETPEGRITTVKGSDEKVQRYVSSSTELEIVSSSQQVTSTCETPNGVLETERDGGEQSTTFEGVNRGAVEASCEDARAQLQDGTTKLAQISADIGLVERQVEIDSLDPEAEHVTITNTGPVTVDLQGWTVTDEAGNSFTFEDASLEPDESLTLKSGDAAEDCEQYCWTQIVWNDGGDTATLTNTDDKTVDTFSYGE
jgi:hypothetical protein